ncbi:MAG: hypothetical protein OXB86_04500 [Bdellovibrionales bacterium]|nr:hypothetical protein [Bdellovibrionales bacterium]
MKLAKIIKWEYGKWTQSIKTALIKSTNYKMDFFLSLIVPVCVYFFIKYNLWSSIYHFNSGEKQIQGYSLDKMIQYQFWIMIFDFFVRAHFFSENLSESIRLGKISSFLLYPFGFIKYQLSLFISDKIIQLGVGGLALSLALCFYFTEPLNGAILIKSFFLMCLVSGFWFVIQIIVGLLAFWHDETWSLNVCFRFIAAFLSGSLLPLDFYPEALTKILLWTPFPYLIYFPVKGLMGEPINFGFTCLVLGVWIIGLSFFMGWLWKRGLKFYTGSGI